MPTRIALLHFVSVLLHLVQDAVRFLLLGTSSSAALKGENLFLRKQLALYLERKAKAPGEPKTPLVSRSGRLDLNQRIHAPQA